MKNLTSALPILFTVLTACPSEDPPPAVDAGTADAGAADAGSPDSGDPGLRTVELDVSAAFQEGDRVRDAYSASTATVGPSGLISLDVDPSGVVLLERDQAAGEEATFTWDNATVYFAITDRFFNGDPTNDGAYGREPDGEQEVATFHGGDFVGLTQQLDHIENLGATAIWITPPVQQIGGWTPGGGGRIKSYPYHGYWALDFTTVDASYGTRAELKAFVDAAHARGIRVLFDIVMNHPGYATFQDIETYMPAVLSDLDWESFVPGAGQTYFDLFDIVDFDHPDWDTSWWGTTWVRADVGTEYSASGTADQNVLLGQVAFLPDFRTEDFRPAVFPPLLAAKSDTNAVPLGSDATVRDYLVKWHTDWVRELGVDGFRVDTAKHVENASWAELKTAATQALRDWKTANAADKLDDLDFWMVGEVFPPPQGLEAPLAARGDFLEFFSEGEFDALINFDFNSRLRRDANVVNRINDIDDVFSAYATAINDDPDFSVMTYISSHDTFLYFETTGGDLARQHSVGTWLMMMPGPVQVFYGDETGRRAGPDAEEEELGTRSDMNWDDFDADLLEHWQKLGQFRKRHVAVGAGTHQRVSRERGYAFVRDYAEGDLADRVMIFVLDPSELTD